ncbi:helix-turn-helix domain-containing protein [Streptosporangium sp. V21-05]|uniref:helix-turn-helix domain-containing protein n=1 Tax=Streptosporangium sp. V21-05 TaxID=3446115 RepID=UPI003F53D53F
MAESLMLTVDRNVRALRAGRGLSQEDLAAASGLTRPSIANVEAGRQNTTLTVLAGLAAALGVEPPVLLADVVDGEQAAAGLLARVASAEWDVRRAEVRAAEAEALAATEHARALQERAGRLKAEAAGGDAGTLARFRRFLDEDFRQWCSPYGVAAKYADDLLRILDQGGSNGR